MSQPNYQQKKRITTFFPFTLANRKVQTVLPDEIRFVKSFTYLHYIFVLKALFVHLIWVIYLHVVCVLYA